MRYELRYWTDTTNTDYVIRQSSNQYKSIKEQYNRACFSSSKQDLLHIVDTLYNKKIP